MNTENKSTEVNGTDKKLHISDVSKRYMILKYEDSLEKYIQYSKELDWYSARKMYRDSINILKYKVIMAQIYL